MLTGQAVAQASGSPQQALEDAGITIQRRELAGLAAIYYPPRRMRPNGLLALNGVDHTEILSKVLAHYYLEHRTLPFYGYGPDGTAVYDAPREEREALAWAQEFSAHCLPSK